MHVYLYMYVSCTRTHLFPARLALYLYIPLLPDTASKHVNNPLPPRMLHTLQCVYSASAHMFATHLTDAFLRNEFRSFHLFLQLGSILESFVRMQTHLNRLKILAFDTVTYFFIIYHYVIIFLIYILRNFFSISFPPSSRNNILSQPRLMAKCKSSLTNCQETRNDDNVRAWN